jgi:hypothetical protein
MLCRRKQEYLETRSVGGPFGKGASRLSRLRLLAPESLALFALSAVSHDIGRGLLETHPVRHVYPTWSAQPHRGLGHSPVNAMYHGLP